MVRSPFRSTNQTYIYYSHDNAVFAALERKISRLPTPLLCPTMEIQGSNLPEDAPSSSSSSAEQQQSSERKNVGVIILKRLHWKFFSLRLSRCPHSPLPMSSPPSPPPLAWLSLDGRLLHAHHATSIASVFAAASTPDIGRITPDVAVAWQGFEPLQRTLMVAIVAVASAKARIAARSEVAQLRRTVAQQETELDSARQEIVRLQQCILEDTQRKEKISATNPNKEVLQSEMKRRSRRKWNERILSSNQDNILCPSAETTTLSYSDGTAFVRDIFCNDIHTDYTQSLSASLSHDLVENTLQFPVSRLHHTLALKQEDWKLPKTIMASDSIGDHSSCLAVIFEMKRNVQQLLEREASDLINAFSAVIEKVRLMEILEKSNEVQCRLPQQSTGQDMQAVAAFRKCIDQACQQIKSLQSAISEMWNPFGQESVANSTPLQQKKSGVHCWKQHQMLERCPPKRLALLEISNTGIVQPRDNGKENAGIEPEISWNRSFGMSEDNFATSIHSGPLHSSVEQLLAELEHAAAKVACMELQSRHLEETLKASETRMKEVEGKLAEALQREYDYQAKTHLLVTDLIRQLQSKDSAYEAVMHSRKLMSTIHSKEILELKQDCEQRDATIQEVAAAAQETEKKLASLEVICKRKDVTIKRLKEEIAALESKVFDLTNIQTPLLLCRKKSLSTTTLEGGGGGMLTPMRKFLESPSCPLDMDTPPPITVAPSQSLLWKKGQGRGWQLSRATTTTTTNNNRGDGLMRLDEEQSIASSSSSDTTTTSRGVTTVSPSTSLDRCSLESVGSSGGGLGRRLSHHQPPASRGGGGNNEKEALTKRRRWA